VDGGHGKNNEISIFRNDYLPKVMTTGHDQATAPPPALLVEENYLL